MTKDNQEGEITVSEIIDLFKKEFKPILDKFIILKLLEGKRKLDIDGLSKLKLPSEDNDYIWYPGVYVFFGGKKPYRVGRHLTNSRLRVLQHLKDKTGNGKHNVWDIKDMDDREIILFNVKDEKDYHWVAAVEIFLEEKLKDKLVIPAKRQG